MKISDILTDKQRDVETIDAGAPLSGAISALTGTKVRSLVVLSDGSVAGMLTVRDVLACLDRRGAEALAKPVSDAMTSSVTTITSSLSVEEALDRFAKHGINHLPVVDDGKLVGLVTPSDVLAGHLEEEKEFSEHFRRYIHGSHVL